MLMSIPFSGTIANCLSIILGGACGLLLGNRMSERLQEALMRISGVTVIFLGIFGACEKALVLQDGTLSSQGGLMCILSLAIGTLIGELLNIEGLFEKFGSWLRKKSGSQDDNRFLDAFLTASLTVCIGAMAIIGSLRDGIYHDPSVFYAKAVIDFPIIAVVAASLGKGALFSAVPVGILQGGMTACAVLIAPFLSEVSLNNISLVGNILIACVGINLLFGQKIRVANCLPGLLLAWLCAYLGI